MNRLKVALKERAGVSNKRVLITGATGLLGRQVLRVFDEHGWDTRGLGLTRAHGRIVRCDLLNPLEIEAQVLNFRPDIVIHCAAERRPDVLEEDRAFATKINVDLTRDIGRICAANGAWVIFISTNYVFDGKDAPYKEDAAPRPINTYGESKLAGERALAEVQPSAAIVRVPLLYGPIEYISETSVTALLNAIQKEAPKLDNWQERFPTCTRDVARVLESFAGAYVARASVAPQCFRGIFHWQSNERFTKYTMGLAIAEMSSINTGSFVKIDSPPSPGSAPRPQFERMLCGRLEAVLNYADEAAADSFRSDFHSSLRQYLQPFLRQRNSCCNLTRVKSGVEVYSTVLLAFVFVLLLFGMLWETRMVSPIYRLIFLFMLLGCFCTAVKALRSMISNLKAWRAVMKDEKGMVASMC